MKLMMTVALLISLTLAPSLVSAQDFADCSQVVSTNSGPVKGVESETAGVCAWLGIPYASPPIGELRWKRPALHESWTEPLVAENFGPKCVQKESMLSLGKTGELAGEEDCLYLNIWRPKKSGTFPVMFWIHGGTLLTGSGSMPMYLGDLLAASHDVVVVTINYRLGPLGFLAHPEFKAEDADGAVGGYGHLDQIFALTWVKDNIAGFGGDPGNITIFGESAGGWSVCTLMATPRAAGLFQQAIKESGGCRRSKTLEQGFAFGEELANNLGCAGPVAAKCMRGKSADQIIEAVPWDETGQKSPFAPHEDGYLLKKMPLDHLIDGDYNHVPFMAGSNRDETRPLIALSPGKMFMSKKQYQKLIEEEYGEFAEQLLKVYPVEAFENATEAYIQKDSDRILGCGGHDAVDALARHQAEVYYYRFDYDEIRLGGLIGAFHGLEIPFVFGSFERKPISMLFNAGQVERARGLSQSMQAYWVNFAKTGNPNAQGLPEWPVYTLANRGRLVFDNNIYLIREPDEQFERCDFWDRHWRSTQRGELP